MRLAIYWFMGADTCGLSVVTYSSSTRETEPVSVSSLVPVQLLTPHGCVCDAVAASTAADCCWECTERSPSYRTHPLSASRDYRQSENTNMTPISVSTTMLLSDPTVTLPSSAEKDTS
jgi:hypothetical protein